MNVFRRTPVQGDPRLRHNPAAFAAMADLADRLDVKGAHRWLSQQCRGTGATRMLRHAQVLAGHFDHYICKADDKRRGRGHDEIPQMFRRVLMRKWRLGQPIISVIPTEVEAVEAALEMAAAGDLLVVFGDDTARCWKQIIYFNSETEDEGGRGDASCRTGCSGF